MPKQRVAAIIPARGGSKGIPGKNLRPVGGEPLVVRACRAALAARTIDTVWVTTDDPAIEAAALRAGADVIRRPAQLADDRASSESALLHALGVLPETPDVLVFMQATSPFIRPTDLDAAVDRVLAGHADVVLSALRTHEFLWREGDDGTLAGVNHDPAARPRRQDRPAEWRETGAFYAMRADGFARHRHRFFGRVLPQPVAPRDALEIDEPADLELANLLERAERNLPERAPDALAAAAAVDLLVTDFDGVHTDDHAYLDERGHEAVRVNRTDGMGVSRLLQAGVGVLILSTETNPVVSARARKLGIPALHGQRDKGAALTRWLADEGIDPARVAYLGNDVNDIACLRSVGWPVVVADAHPDVLEHAQTILTRRGGDGAVRELADLILAARTNAAHPNPAPHNAAHPEEKEPT